MQQTIYTLGIDPGKTGAAALLGNGRYFDVWDYAGGKENAQRIKEILIIWGIDLCVIEKSTGGVYGKRKNKQTGKSEGVSMGSVSAHSYGENSGHWKGILDALDIRWVEVRPNEWTKKFIFKDSSKESHRETAQRLFPDAPLNLKKHHGRADALMIALWGYRNFFINHQTKGFEL